MDIALQHRGTASAIVCGFAVPAGSQTPMSRCKMPLALVAAILGAAAARGQSNGSAPSRPLVPLVVVVGCAGRTVDPLIWNLSRAGKRRETMQAGITGAERQQLAHEPLGSDIYHLAGVAEFVDAESSTKVGVRSEILSPPRVNATGMLAEGHRVAVKGLYVATPSANINLTSVVDLGPDCS